MEILTEGCINNVYKGKFHCVSCGCDFLQTEDKFIYCVYVHNSSHFVRILTVCEGKCGYYARGVEIPMIVVNRLAEYEKNVFVYPHGCRKLFPISEVVLKNKTFFTKEKLNLSCKVCSKIHEFELVGVDPRIRKYVVDNNTYIELSEI
jgi:hypothetical protein